MYIMWTLVCKPMVIPETRAVTTKWCRVATVSPTDNKSRFVIDMPEEVPEINISREDCEDKPKIKV